MLVYQTKWKFASWEALCLFIKTLQGPHSTHPPGSSSSIDLKVCFTSSVLNITKFCHVPRDEEDFLLAVGQSFLLIVILNCMWGMLQKVACLWYALQIFQMKYGDKSNFAKTFLSRPNIVFFFTTFGYKMEFLKWMQIQIYIIQWFKSIQIKHRKHCECCPLSLLIVR